MVIPVVVALMMILIGWVHKAIKPPPPKICGSIGGPEVTSPRVKLSDGRYLAYREFGVNKEEARYKIIVIHGFGSSKDSNLPVSQELIEDLGIYFLYFDRAGYGESDPHSSRSVKSEAYDIQELADELQIGHKFYVVGMSMGGYPVWSCLKYIPHRLSGAALVAPFISYWWPSFPENLLREAFLMLPQSDKWTFRVAHYAPWLFYWWMTQKWFPSLTLTNMLSPDDIEIVKSLSEVPNTGQGTQLAPNHNDSSSDDFSVVSPRIKLRDGRHLAYIERGVSKDTAKYKVIIVHGFGSSKEMNFLAPQELIDELGIYLLQYDRAGYGESDPNPKRSLKSEALDIQELADQLQLGPQFYVIGVSMGSYATWSCLKYLPHRLAGLALIAPVINYRWPSFPKRLIKEDYRRKLVHWSMWLANHWPRLLHWWVTRKWLPSTAVIEKNPAFFNKTDVDILKTIPGFPMLTKDSLREQVVFDTLRHDWRVAFGKWEFDPMKLSNPFPHNTSSFHIWHGYEDKVVPSELQRFVSGKLPWIHYHEVPDGGHLIIYHRGLCEAILRALLLGQENIPYRSRPSLFES